MMTRTVLSVAVTQTNKVLTNTSIQPNINMTIWTGFTRTDSLKEVFADRGLLRNCLVREEAFIGFLAGSSKKQSTDSNLLRVMKEWTTWLTGTFPESREEKTEGLLWRVFWKWLLPFLFQFINGIDAFFDYFRSLTADLINVGSNVNPGVWLFFDKSSSSDINSFDTESATWFARDCNRIMFRRQSL